MALKRRIPAQAHLEIPNPNPDLRRSQESTGKSELVLDIAEIARDMCNMKQSLDILMEAFNRRPA